MMKIKKIRKKPKVWLFPSAVEREYVKSLERIADKLAVEVDSFMQYIQPCYNTAIRQDDFIDFLYRAFEELLTALTFHAADSKIREMVVAVTDEANRFNKKQFHQVLKKAYGVDIFTSEKGLADKLKLFELQNIDLIKSLPTQLHEKLRNKFVEAVQNGKRWETVAKDIEAITGATKKRARLIARDQIGKLNGQLTQIRQREIGVKSYIWRTSLDERVRKWHLDREGKQFDWDNPPDDGHPGEPIQCRCYAEAVLPDLDNLIEQKGIVVTGDVHVVEQPKEQQLNLTTIELLDDLKAQNIEYRPVQILSSQLSSDDIIAKLAGGDETKGSCASLALSYIGNRIGLDVTDYRGGKSCDFFSRDRNVNKLFSAKGVTLKVFDVIKEASEVASILETELIIGKEYYLSTGMHAAIVRRSDNGLEYLELQSDKKNGWTSFSQYGSIVRTLNKRFGCKLKAEIFNSIRGKKAFIKKAQLAEVDSFENAKQDLKEVLGYLNTATEQQKKGSLGGIK